MFKVINKTSCKIFSIFGIEIFKIKEKTAKFKIYLFGITIGVIPKTLVLRCNNPHSINDFVKFLFNTNKNLSSSFVKITQNPYVRKDNDVKLLAYYLPQFHAIPLNDENIQKGFTEWNNVAKALPHFTGHYQPQLPIDVGFYDLSHDDVMYRQIELAKMYGIYGFCFHYYWFSGDRLLEKPIFNWLNNKDLDFPFCFCWANENWSKLWDGGNKELLKKQELKKDDDEKFFYDILPFFKDERYIKIDNKPVLIIYNPLMFEKARFLKFINNIRALAQKEDFDDLYIIATNCRGFNSQKEWQFDAIAEFPPHNLQKPKFLSINKHFRNHLFQASITDMKDYIENKKYMYFSDNNLFKGVFPSWDNTARKAYSGAGVYWGETPELYKMWLSDCIKWTKANHPENEQFVFINAWNEWAEGAHLEPDHKYGYAYLQATKDAMENGQT
ncbi:putative glycosyl transferase [Clostridium sp. CAG:306]|nr:putative glycosyl transferase [Clostridium sp. CAG:306]